MTRGWGVIRHADAGYELAKDTARETDLTSLSDLLNLIILRNNKSIALPAF